VYDTHMRERGSTWCCEESRHGQALTLQFSSSDAAPYILASDGALSSMGTTKNSLLQLQKIVGFQL
jgi:hypothetical protein